MGATSGDVAVRKVPQPPAVASTARSTKNISCPQCPRHQAEMPRRQVRRAEPVAHRHAGYSDTKQSTWGAISLRQAQDLTPSANPRVPAAQE